MVVNFEKIMEKALNEEPLSSDEIHYILELTDSEKIEKVFETACSLRKRYFDNKVFLYGFVYFSTYCRNDCAFCFYRKSNPETIRYRKDENEIIETAVCLAESGVHLIDLTMGEDPKYFSNNYQGFDKLLNLVQKVKKDTKLPIMISPGVVPEKYLLKFKEAGVDWYACYQETHNKELYSKMRLEQDYAERFEAKVAAKKMGLLVEEGLLSGIGDTTEDIIVSLENMKKLSADQVRVMSFVPQKGTPMKDWKPISRMRELLIIAVMRLVFPDRLIPASLDVDGIMGLKKRLLAGANVVTSIIPPKVGLAGVSQSSLDIDDGNRTVNGILPIIESLGLRVAENAEYEKWVENRKKLTI